MSEPGAPGVTPLPHPLRRAAIVLALAAAAAMAHDGSCAAQPPLQAPNVVAISPTLVTSGQPAAAELSRLSALGFGAVVYLAPPTASDAVSDEAEIVRSQGLEFVNILIPFGKPTEAHFESFVAAMNRLRDRKVLVHCQVNMRASTMTFLYRVIVDREKPDPAYEAVARVWSPDGPWKRLLVAQLQEAGIAFEPD